MQYKYRWLYAILLFFILIALAYWWVLSPSLQIIKEKRTQIQVIENELRLLEKSRVDIHHAPKRIMQKMDVLALLPILTQSKHVRIRSVTTKSMKLNETKIKLVLEGEWLNLSEFIRVLSEQVPNGIIENISLQISGINQLQLAVDWVLLTESITTDSVIKPPLQMHNLFCLTSDSAVPIRSNDSVTASLSGLQEMHMVGYYAQGERRQALIALSNGAVEVVHLGDQLGREKGWVTNIQSDKIEVMLPSQQKIILKM